MQDIPEIDIDAAKKHLDDESARFLDIRDPGSFSAAHIAGATLLTDDCVEDFLAEADRDKTTIVYCYHGNMSRGGTAYLMEQGFKNVFSMSGGFESWRGRYEHEPDA